MGPIDGDSATGLPAQDVSTRLEDILYPSDETPTDDEVASADDENLPSDDDTDLDEEGGVDEKSEEDEISDEDLSLADYLGIPEEKLKVGEDGSVIFQATIDGETSDVNLKDLVKSYQLQGHVNNKSISLENDKKEFEDTKTKAYTELLGRIESNEALTKVLEEQLVGDYNRVDWDALRIQNPSEWAALRQEFADRAQKVQQALGTVSAEKEKLTKEQQAELQGKQAEYQKEQYQKILSDNPTWEDQEVMSKELGAIGSFLQANYGFSDQDMVYMTDSRALKMAQDAMAYREGKKGVEQKKVQSNLPRFQKPNSSKANAANLAKARAVKAKKQAIRKSGGSVGSIANSIIDRM